MSKIARLKMTLDGIKPAILRRVEVPAAIRLDRLHLVFQAAMGWDNDHLYEIRAGDTGWGMPDEETGGWGDGPLDARKANLLAMIEDAGAMSFKYIYDFGDDWMHTVKVERLEEAAPGITYPRLLEAKGACPPEDIGGWPGYEEFLEAMADPCHARHKELAEWAGDDFDPAFVDIKAIEKNLAALAKRWAAKPAKKRLKKT